MGLFDWILPRSPQPKTPPPKPQGSDPFERWGRAFIRRDEIEYWLKENFGILREIAGNSSLLAREIAKKFMDLLPEGSSLTRNYLTRLQKKLEEVIRTGCFEGKSLTLRELKIFEGVFKLFKEFKEKF